jgi:hypothetical protein
MRFMPRHRRTYPINIAMYASAKIDQTAARPAIISPSVGLLALLIEEPPFGVEPYARRTKGTPLGQNVHGCR